MTIPKNDDELAALVRNGDRNALGTWLSSNTGRLEKVIRLRLDRRVVRRVNHSDVIQDTFMEAARRIKEYLDNPEVPFFIWLRFLAVQRISQLHRAHLGVQARDVHREVPIGRYQSFDDTSELIAAQFVSNLTSPSVAVQKSEMQRRLHEVLSQLDPMDREVLALRHFEHLTNSEVSTTLNLSVSAASKRYIRALDHLRTALSTTTCLLGENAMQAKA